MKRTRRRTLAAIGSAAVLSLSGCSGSGSSDDPGAISCAFRVPRHPEREDVLIQGFTTIDRTFVLAIQLNSSALSVDEAVVSAVGSGGAAGTRTSTGSDAEVHRQSVSPAEEVDDGPASPFPVLGPADDPREFRVRWTTPEIPFDRTYRVTFRHDGERVDEVVVGGSCRRND